MKWKSKHEEWSYFDCVTVPKYFEEVKNRKIYPHLSSKYEPKLYFTCHSSITSLFWKDIYHYSDNIEKRKSILPLQPLYNTKKPNNQIVFLNCKNRRISQFARKILLIYTALSIISNIGKKYIYILVSTFI